MPKKKMPHQPCMRVIRERVRAYLAREGITATELSRRAGVNQSTVQRLLSGFTKNPSKKVRQVLIYANIDINDCIASARGLAIENSELQRALELVCDGQAATAERLARVIMALAPFINSSQSLMSGKERAI